MITDIKEKLADMQAKYIDKQSAEDTLKKVDNRKTAKIKKKLASLEVERCHKLLAKKDVTAIDKKISKQKELFLIYPHSIQFMNYFSKQGYHVYFYQSTSKIIINLLFYLYNTSFSSNAQHKSFLFN